MLLYLLETCFRWFGPYAPYNRWGDRFKACNHFYRTLRRMPTDKMLLNDYLYRIKTSDEIFRPERVFTSDKEFVKTYIAGKVGHQYNVSTIAILRSKEEIRKFQFPADCVIKPTHASARVIFRVNNSNIDINQILGWMDLNYYNTGREANYRYLKPKIIVEPFVFDKAPNEDVKVFCYNGEPKVIRCSFGKKKQNTRKFYTADWVDLKMSMGFPVADETKSRPKNLDEILDVSRVLSADFDFVRVDFYHTDEKLYVGELTHIHGNAKEKFYPPEAEQVISGLIFGTDTSQASSGHSAP